MFSIERKYLFYRKKFDRVQNLIFAYLSTFRFKGLNQSFIINEFVSLMSISYIHTKKNEAYANSFYIWKTKQESSD